MTAVNLFAAYATNEKLEIDGTIMPLRGVNFTIARSGNRAYGKLLSKLYNQFQTVLDGKDEAADKKSDEIMIEVIATTILRGWEGKVIVEEGGKPVEYSIDNAKKLLKLKDFRADVMRMAEGREAFLLKKVDEQEKN